MYRIATIHAANRSNVAAWVTAPMHKNKILTSPHRRFFCWSTVVKKYIIGLVALIVIALTAWDASAQDTSATKTSAECPTLNVTGLKPNEGTLMIAVYSRSEEFFKKAAWMTAQKVSSASMQIPVCNLDAEDIAVTAFQDMNGNQKLDSNPIGIPTEPYAASGTPAMFGAPTWKDTKVAYKGVTAPIAIKF
jgi:uncharacterized protein (DUF2141 family)